MKWSPQLDASSLQKTEDCPGPAFPPHRNELRTAPLQVRTHIPVVFFTAKGVPGEVDEGMDSVKGAIAACARAMKNTSHAAGEAP